MSEGGSLDVFGIPIFQTRYANGIFLVIMEVYVMSHVERIVIKFTPDVVRTVFETLFTILIMVPLTFCLIGPAGDFLGNYVASAVYWLYDKQDS